MKGNSLRPIDKACEKLLRAAILAPSGDNTQPWRFAVDSKSRRISIYLDENRDPSPMNSGQRMARLAIGAAVENMLCAAESLGWQVEPEEPRNGALASLRIVNCEENSREIAPAISSRGTNRRVYDCRPLSAEAVADLERAVFDYPEVQTIWIHQRERVLALADLVGRADALMLGEPSMRLAFLDNIRFDTKWNAEVDEGLSLASLELPVGDRIALRMMRYLPNWLLRLGGAPRKFAAAGRRLVASSSGICIVTEKEGTVRSELLAGRALQRAWLALTEGSLAVQPIMSIAILESVLRRGSHELLASLGRQRALDLVDELRTLTPEIGQASVAFVMRFGYAPPPTVRTGRLELGARLTEING
jgi:hypothetical protein